MHVLTSENTALPLLQKEVEIAKATLPVKYYKREYEASFDVFHGKIFDIFNEKIHVVDWTESIRASERWIV